MNYGQKLISKPCEIC